LKSISKGERKMKAYSQDLRERILRAVDQGKTRDEIVQLFGISHATIKRYVKQRREQGHVQPKAIPGRPPTKRAPLEAGLQAQLEKQPDATLQEHCDAWEAETGIRVSSTTMSRAIEHVEWSRKKKSSKQRREKRKSASNGKRKHKRLIEEDSYF
jgi:transposase